MPAQLCRLLEADQNHARSRAVVTRNLQDDPDLAEESNDTTEYALQRRRTFVSYSKFYNEYWPHLPQNLTKNLGEYVLFACTNSHLHSLVSCRPRSCFRRDYGCVLCNTWIESSVQ